MCELYEALFDGILSYRNGETECGALAGRRLDPYLAVVGLDDMLDDGES